MGVEQRLVLRAGPIEDGQVAPASEEHGTKEDRDDNLETKQVSGDETGWAKLELGVDAPLALPSRATSTPVCCSIAANSLSLERSCL